jgi:hypothetical protein
MSKLLFVGECRSITAQKKGWTWKDGRLAAKPLFEALAAMGVDPKAHRYTNLWVDQLSGEAGAFIAPATLAMLSARRREGVVLVALGQRVSKELAKRGIVHVALVHPAARGAIRKRERYHEHVKTTLGPALRRSTYVLKYSPSDGTRHGYYSRGVYSALQRVDADHFTSRADAEQIRARLAPSGRVRVTIERVRSRHG